MENLTLEKMIDRCDMYRSLYKSAHQFRKDEYYEKWQHYKNLLSEHAKQNGYKVQLYFKQEPNFIPMSDWTERYEEYGN
jgi:hypothetical protein